MNIDKEIEEILKPFIIKVDDPSMLPVFKQLKSLIRKAAMECVPEKKKTGRWNQFTGEAEQTNLSSEDKIYNQTREQMLSNIKKL